jgi:hypothetical protein
MSLEKTVSGGKSFRENFERGDHKKFKKNMIITGYPKFTFHKTAPKCSLQVWKNLYPRSVAFKDYIMGEGGSLL